MVRGLFWFYFEVKLDELNLSTLVWLSMLSGAQQMRHNIQGIFSDCELRTSSA